MIFNSTIMQHFVAKFGSSYTGVYSVYSIVFSIVNMFVNKQRFATRLIAGSIC